MLLRWCYPTRPSGSYPPEIHRFVHLPTTVTLIELCTEVVPRRTSRKLRRAHVTSTRRPEMDIVQVGLVRDRADAPVKARKGWMTGTSKWVCV